MTIKDEFESMEMLQSQTNEDGITTTRSVRPVARSILTWWKNEMGQSDILDIADDTDSCTLNFDVELPSTADASVIIEGDEINQLSTIYIYQHNLTNLEIDQANLHKLLARICLFNNEANFGRIEAMIDEQSTTLRYRYTISLAGVLHGKAKMISHQYKNCIKDAETLFPMIESAFNSN